jgi:Amt family ammonium transporter
VLGIVIAFSGGYAIYGLLKKTMGIRLDPEQEFEGADLSIHKISSTAERESSW